MLYYTPLEKLKNTIITNEHWLGRQKKNNLGKFQLILRPISNIKHCNA